MLASRLLVMFRLVRRGPDDQALARLYRELATKYHPDTGGSVENFKALQWAYEQAQKGRETICPTK